MEIFYKFIGFASSHTHTYTHTHTHTHTHYNWDDINFIINL